MNKVTVFIDGAEGTTGLRLADRLRDRDDVELIAIAPELRKDAGEKARLSNLADIVFLCLPDAAARESAAAITNPATKIIDASTAHRIADGWVYGFPELSASHREALRTATRVGNPGCYATGFISLVYPLIAGGIASPDYPFTCHAISGYSGAGKGMIAKYEDPERAAYYASPRQYALGQAHKHLPEMRVIAGLHHPPLFNPIIADIYAGMVVTVPLLTRHLSRKVTPEELHAHFAAHYQGQRAVKVMPFGAQDANEGAMIDANGIDGRDILEIYVCGNPDQMVLLARLDNLGKGASGAAIQCMNIMCGFDEMKGLNE
ncbi:N-acetyl-gamma-glutamyl-phosphate reductase [Ruminococcaceae bacterium OttesenSCG-928-L11]|nr:N-acetyl-gamma-glutamyl-phosphate reductase [Ruminococcaceae bacterium OttesenSCG-928-L11]